MQDPNLDNTIPSHPNRSIEETVPSHVPSVTENAETRPTALETTQPVQGPAGPAPTGKPSKARRWPWILLGVLLVLLLGGLGAWLGYQSAVQLRRAKAEEQKVTLATEQFMLGLVAQQEKRYNIARQHFEFVIKLDPTFPGAADRLREVMIAQAATATPTIAPTVATPTLTPTPDTRPQEEILATARQQFANQEWDNLFATIDSLRRVDPSFHAVEVDGMLYFALRFRGVQKILQQGNLEGGIYDLALAEKFGPLDVDAQGYRNWARQYLNGASFWEVDWVRVVNYFEDIYPSFPNLHDGSGYTAIERYRIAAREQANKLAAEGKYCEAIEYYEKSLYAVPDGELAVTATAVYEACYPPTATVDPALLFTPTPTVTPTVEQTVAPATTEPPQAPTEDTEDPPPAEETEPAPDPATTGEPPTDG